MRARLGSQHHHRKEALTLMGPYIIAAIAALAVLVVAAVLFGIIRSWI